MKSKHLPLIIGVALPVLFIIIISLVIFTPSLSVKPQHNFIYTTENPAYYSYNETYKNTYRVEGEKIVQVPIVYPAENPRLQDVKDAATLYLYDVKANTSHQITLEEAAKYVVDPGPSSPDGYSVEYTYGHDGIFEIFGSNNSNDGYFISNGKGKKRLGGITNYRYYGSGNFRLIAWIK